jgi:hypothetical protein
MMVTPAERGERITSHMFLAQLHVDANRRLVEDKNPWLVRERLGSRNMLSSLGAPAALLISRSSPARQKSQLRFVSNSQSSIKTSRRTNLAIAFCR